MSLKVRQPKGCKTTCEHRHSFHSDLGTGGNRETKNSLNVTATCNPRLRQLECTVSFWGKGHCDVSLELPRFETLLILETELLNANPLNTIIAMVMKGDQMTNPAKILCSTSALLKQWLYRFSCSY